MTEKFLIWCAWRVPRRLAYWCAVRVMSAATVGRYSSEIVGDLRCLEALERWRHPKERRDVSAG